MVHFENLRLLLCFVVALFFRASSSPLPLPFSFPFPFSSPFPFFFFFFFRAFLVKSLSWFGKQNQRLPWDYWL
jgi:hypothetical protein